MLDNKRAVAHRYLLAVAILLLLTAHAVHARALRAEMTGKGTPTVGAHTATITTWMAEPVNSTELARSNATVQRATNAANTSHSSRNNEFAAPVDFPITAVPKVSTPLDLKNIGPGHMNPVGSVARPLPISVNPALPGSNSMSDLPFPAADTLSQNMRFTGDLLSDTQMTSNLPTASAAPTSSTGQAAAATAPQPAANNQRARNLVVGNAVPRTTMPATGTPMASLAGANAGYTDCQLVANESGKEAVKCIKDVTGVQHSNTLPLNTATSNAATQQPLNLAAASSRSPAPVAMQFTDSFIYSSAPVQGAGLTTSSTAPTRSSPTVSVLVPSPSPATRRNITIIHDPAITASSAGQDQLVDDASDGTISLTVTAEPVIPSSGLSIADYYEDDLAGDNLSQDLPPQVPAGTAPLPAASTSTPSSAKQNIVGGLTTGSRTLPGNSASSGPTTMSRADARPVSSPAWQPTTKSDPPVNAANVVNTSSKNVFGHTWETAPVCSGSPARNNSVQDATGRLWWWEDNHSCAYRAVDGAAVYYNGYVAVQWETSPACNFPPTSNNAMADANGRAWGWNKELLNNCKFLQASADAQMSGRAFMYADIPDAEASTV